MTEVLDVLAWVALAASRALVCLGLGACLAVAYVLVRDAWRSR